MQRKIGQQLRKEFERRLIEVLPDFRRDRHAVIPQGWYQFSMLQMGVRIFVRLVTHQLCDEFTVEMAWSSNESCPVCIDSPRDIPRANIVASQPKNGQFGFRLPLLWTDGVDCWWALSERFPDDFAKEMGLGLDDATLPIMSIDAAVNHAIERVQELGIPFLIKQIRNVKE